MFEDSVAPVHAAGLTKLWEDSYTINSNLRLNLAPGHTPGSSVVTLASGTDRAVFVGDMLHSPVQFVEPDANSCFCEDPAEARATRRKVLGWDRFDTDRRATMRIDGEWDVVEDPHGEELQAWPFPPLPEVSS